MLCNSRDLCTSPLTCLRQIELYQRQRISCSPFGFVNIAQGYVGDDSGGSSDSNDDDDDDGDDVFYLIH